MSTASVLLCERFDAPTSVSRFFCLLWFFTDRMRCATNCCYCRCYFRHWIKIGWRKKNSRWKLWWWLSNKTITCAATIIFAIIVVPTITELLWLLLKTFWPQRFGAMKITTGTTAARFVVRCCQTIANWRKHLFNAVGNLYKIPENVGLEFMKI